jgi:polysaccharide pyruvyl transferase WcaK-like protein
MGADCALNVRPSPRHTALAMLKEGGVPEDGPLMTINVNSYLNVFLGGGARTVDVSDFASCIARTVDRLVDDLGLRMSFVVTQPMDLKLTREVMARIRRRDRVGMVSNVRHSYRDLAAVFAAAELHLGMRTHSLILPTAVGTPAIGIIATPKNRGFMRSIDQDDLMIEFPDLTTDHLVEVVEKAWKDRAVLRERLAPIAAREKGKARRSARSLTPHLADGRPR